MSYAGVPTPGRLHRREVPERIGRPREGARRHGSKSVGTAAGQAREGRTDLGRGAGSASFGHAVCHKFKAAPASRLLHDCMARKCADETIAEVKLKQTIYDRYCKSGSRDACALAEAGRELLKKSKPRMSGRDYLVYLEHVSEIVSPTADRRRRRTTHNPV